MSLSLIYRLSLCALAAAFMTVSFGTASQARIIRSSGQSGGSNQCDGNSLTTVIGVFAEIPNTNPQAYDGPAGQTSFSFLDPIPGLFGSGCGDTYSYEFDQGEDLELGVSWAQAVFAGDFWGNATPSYEFTITSTTDTSMTWTFASPDTSHTFLAPSGLLAGDYDVELNLIITADAGFALADAAFGPGDIWAPLWDPAQQGYVSDSFAGTYTLGGDYIARMVIVPGAASASVEAPEPAASLLILSGVGVLILHRRRRRKIWVTA